MGTSDAPGTHFSRLGHIPDQFDLDNAAYAAHIAGRYYEKWPRSFLSYAAQEHYPRRLWATMGALLRVGKGRPRFRCKIKEIAEASGQHPRTVKRALPELEIDGWIEVERWKPKGSYLSARNKYTLPHLLPQ